MKKHYHALRIEILNFDVNDVIVMSIGEGDNKLDDDIFTGL